jgi:hypothetical protein
MSDARPRGVRDDPAVPSGLAAPGGVRPDLDRLEHVADLLRGGVDCDTASVGWWDREAGVVRSLVNVGQLAPTEVPRPVDETYALEDFPALARMLTHREPFAYPPADASDPRFADLAVSFGRDARAAAPIVVHGRVWGELWVARVTREDDARGSIDLGLLQWMADSVALLLAPPRQARSGAGMPALYELRLTGRLSRRRWAEFAPLEASFEAGLTVLRGHVIDQAQLYGHLNRVHGLGLELISFAPAE